VALAVGDLNGDGRVDLAVADDVQGVVHVLLGNGDGTFKQGADIRDDSSPEAVLIADVDGDGKADLVMAGLQSVDIVRGGGDGTFRKPVPYVALGVDISALPALAVADVNGDGRPDVISVAGVVSVMINKGTS
jgi:hypothetical protein